MFWKEAFDRDLELMDKHEGCTYHYQRKQVNLFQEEGDRTLAHVYSSLAVTSRYLLIL